MSKYYIAPWQKRLLLLLIPLVLGMTGMLVYLAMQRLDPPTDPALVPKPGEPRRGLIFEVKGPAGRLYLCGSLHQLTKEDYPLPTAYEKAWKDSAAVVFEMGPTEVATENVQKILPKYADLPVGTLWEALQPATAQKLRHWAEVKKFPLDSIEKKRPWMAAVMIAQRAQSKLGLSEDTGLDKHFRNRAKEEKRPADGLETYENQLLALSSPDSLTQDAMVVQAMEDADGASEQLQALFSHWRKGDPAALRSHLDKSFEKFPQVQKALLTDRNTQWAPKIEALLQSEPVEMVIVGAGHLCGPGSLVELLKSRGFQVEQL
jgi:uncharacterized protein YbaP (TraB family)